MKPRVYGETIIISYLNARAMAVPDRLVRDVVHIAIFTAIGVESLVKRSFRHIADTMVRRRIEFVCRQADMDVAG